MTVIMIISTLAAYIMGIYVGRHFNEIIKE